tara:strand:+ start:202 stop:459 length:258 start_codon:yes stop_codon:yes gene_type:complete
MINTFHKISKFILTFSTVLVGWTSILLLSNTTYNLEIQKVIQKMYLNQKDFIFNVKDLSLLLVQDANDRFSDKNQGEAKFNNIKN